MDPSRSPCISPHRVKESPRLATLSLWCESTTEVLTARPTPWVRWRAGEIGKAWIFRPFTILSSSPPAQYPQVNRMDGVLGTHRYRTRDRSGLRAY
jgi:hypothetical protein